jgi:hypothetical protein
MPAYTIGLTRTYSVEIEAPDIESALHAANFVGCPDESWGIEREESGCKIIEVKILEHDAFELP